MTNNEFKDAQLVLGLSNTQMAKKLHYNISMIEHFRSGRVSITDRCAAFVNLLVKYQNLFGLSVKASKKCRCRPSI